MQHRLFVVLVLGLALAVAGAVAQDAEKPQMLSVHEDPVVPSMVGKYEKAAKNLADMITKSGVGITYVAASLDNFTYIYFTGVDGLSGVDKMEASWGELEKKVGKQAFDAAMKMFDDCYPSHKNYLVTMRPELSYKPEYGAALTSDLRFRAYDYYHIHPGMEVAAEEIAKEWVALNKKIGAEEGYRLYASSFGSDSPTFVVVNSAKDELDYVTRREAWLKKAGDEARALWVKTWSVVRKFDTVTGMIRPDISVMPKASSTK